jgi:integrase
VAGPSDLGVQNVERLRSFLRFCNHAGWVKKDPGTALKPPKLPETSTKVRIFTDDQLTAILAACDRYPQRNSFGHDNRARVRGAHLDAALLRDALGDCVGLQTGHLADNKLFLNTQKSGSKIFVPLPPAAVQALKTVYPDGNHSFWTGKGLRKSAVAVGSARCAASSSSPRLTGIPTCSGIRSRLP